MDSTGYSLTAGAHDVMGARKVGGAVLAVLACPCHLPIYLLALGAFGVGTAAVIGYLLPALAIGFTAGLAILLWPDRSGGKVDLACCADDAKSVPGMGGAAQADTP